MPISIKNIETIKVPVALDKAKLENQSMTAPVSVIERKERNIVASQSMTAPVSVLDRK
jgi:hypothetical protein